MSYITDAVITVHHARNDVCDMLEQPLQFDTVRRQSFGRIDLSAAGGTKVFTSDLYAAALNYVSIDDLADWFVGLPWSDYDSATLTAQTESDCCLAVVRFHGATFRVEGSTEAWTGVGALTGALVPPLDTPPF